RRLRLDARGGSARAVPWLEARDGLPPVALGSLLRADDPVPARYRIADALYPGRVLARMATSDDHLRELLVYRRTAAAVRASVRPRLGRFPRPARARAAPRRLVGELGRRDAGAQSIRAEAGGRVPRVYGERLGHHGLG